MKYLVLRRFVQFFILLCFSVGSLNFILIGNLSSSKLFNTIPLSDPFAILQIYLASFSVDFQALLGAFIIFIMYGFIFGRAFCSWVCPINLITDFATFIRKKFNFRQSKCINISKNTRYYILILMLFLSFILSIPAFESISYIAIVQRGIIFLNTSWIFVAFIIFCIDAFLGNRIVCSHVCPLGAFYAFISKFALLKIKYNFEKCTKCFKCVNICPERQVLWMVAKKSASVKSGECIRCGRCIEVCDDDAINFNIFNLKEVK